MDELDKRIQCLPPASGMCNFRNGISGLSQVSSTEQKHISRILLCCLVGKIDPQGIIACWSILHFIHLAQYLSHDKEMLSYMQQELETWNKNCNFFIQNGVQDDFNIPKFYSLQHYIDSIPWLEATDNYKIEMFKCLHIDFAKEGWQASNKCDHFPQMVKWLARQEKIACLQLWTMMLYTRSPGSILWRKWMFLLSSGYLATISLAKTPAELSKSLAQIIVFHATPGFLVQLKLFLAALLPPTQWVSKSTTLEGSLPFTLLDVWHQYKFTPFSLLDDSDAIQKTVKAIPMSRMLATTCFDTVLVLDTDEAESTAVEGMSFCS
ncbi:hypothetical protein GYMLUDRAFT_170266 [Collybiopsis luxurians FD-317 M1]|uniref:Uncharacterized protein n=1 Tax=Collybiopsis luxurians FD-317 M1 TaxID=944289 RepID=A0A0D0CKE5_9AGAR|nr:hypothetical protein GYMLUDRAFT_170266 [Collybiopsis luxurians FD-317 M1]